MSLAHDGGRLFVRAEETEALYLFDLRLIRAQLAARDLDWEAPPLPPAPPAPEGPLRLTLDVGSAPPTSPARRLVAEAYQLTQVREYQEARTALRRALQIDPRNAAAHNNLAWLLLMGPKELRDYEQSLSHARKAVELAGDQATYHNTLGVALYRAGKFAEAVPVLNRSREASKGEDAAFDLFVLAACHHRLGEGARAKELYAEAGRWLEQNRAKLGPDHLEELTELQAEAAKPGIRSGGPLCLQPRRRRRSPGFK
jgi:tetratricopeptide (TPR) repeat protein